MCRWRSETCGVAGSASRLVGLDGTVCDAGRKEGGQKGGNEGRSDTGTMLGKEVGKE